MQTRIQKWGNSLGLRIPRSFAADARVTAGSTVDISMRDGDLVIRPVDRRKYRLKDLLDGIDSRNVHAEVRTGARVGREAW
jgi:antitoxin MazE